MTENPLNVVIVGGSLTALFHGIVLRRLGHNVRILERNLPSQQMSLGAGIAAMEHIQSFIGKYDETKTAYSVPSPNVQYLDQAVKIKSTWNISMAMTSWKILYYVLRANLDGLASDICAQPPKLIEQQGSATYEHGKEVAKVEYKDGLVTVKYRDTGSESYSTIHADLVIAADGASSKVRQTLQPHLKQKYAGYVAWRGTAPEKEISEKTKATFACKTTFYAYKGGYIVLYTIPGEDGNTSPGHRQLNWVWYNSCPENSQEHLDVMTDVDRHRHRTTLPIGKVDPKNWDKQKALALKILPEPFAEMVQKTSKIFISAINDREIAKPSHFNGKLLFVGDSLATFRPHVASSTNQAALDAQLLEQLLKGEIKAEEWEAKVLAFANFTAILEDSGSTSSLEASLRLDTYYLAWGTIAQCTGLMILAVLYNEVGGADNICIVRNLLNALGFLCYGSGTTLIASDAALSNNGVKWFVVIGSVVFTTVHIQDMHDQVGDKARERKSVPLVIRDWPARLTIAFFVGFWSFFCPAFWNLSIYGYLAPVLFGAVVIIRCIRKRGVDDDKVTFLDLECLDCHAILVAAMQEAWILKYISVN